MQQSQPQKYMKSLNFNCFFPLPGATYGKLGMVSWLINRGKSDTKVGSHRHLFSTNIYLYLHNIYLYRVSRDLSFSVSPQYKSPSPFLFFSFSF